MKNVRFTKINAGDCVYLKTELRPNDSINNQIVDIVFESDNLHILPITTCTEYDGVVEVLLGDYISLDKVFSSNIKKEVVLTIIFNLIKELSTLTRKGIKLKYFVLNKRYVYINPEDMSIKFICLPIDNVEHDVEFRIFLRGLLASAKYDTNERLEYVGKLLNCINSDGYSNTLLIELIREIGGQDIGVPIKYISNDTTIGMQSDLESTIAGEITEVNMFDGEIEDTKLSKQFEELRNVSEKEIEPIPCVPYLIRVQKNEKIHIDRERFNLGKSPMSNHYVIDNERVSRYHCAIVYRDGSYYIKDNGSTNCTYVNGIDIGDMAVELINDTTIHIANEEFLFILI